MHDSKTTVLLIKSTLHFATIVEFCLIVGFDLVLLSSEVMSLMRWLNVSATHSSFNATSLMVAKINRTFGHFCVQHVTYLILDSCCVKATSHAQLNVYTEYQHDCDCLWHSPCELCQITAVPILSYNHIHARVILFKWWEAVKESRIY